MPIRPSNWVAWVAEAESTDISPPGVLRHALVLIGSATVLYTRGMPDTLRKPRAPYLCRLQEIPLYTGADSFEEVNENTQLAVFKSCCIADVWRDRDVIKKQLDAMNIVFLCTDPRADEGVSARLARRLGMDQCSVRPFYLVTQREMGEESDAVEFVEASVASTVDELERRGVKRDSLHLILSNQKRLRLGQTL